MNQFQETPMQIGQDMGQTGNPSLERNFIVIELYIVEEQEAAA